MNFEFFIPFNQEIDSGIKAYLRYDILYQKKFTISYPRFIFYTLCDQVRAIFVYPLPELFSLAEDEFKCQLLNCVCKRES